MRREGLLRWGSSSDLGAGSSSFGSSCTGGDPQMIHTCGSYYGRHEISDESIRWEGRGGIEVHFPGLL